MQCGSTYNLFSRS